MEQILKALKSADYTTLSGSIIEVKQDVKCLDICMPSDCCKTNNCNNRKNEITNILVTSLF